jgi:hypothetical protein
VAIGGLGTASLCVLALVLGVDLSYWDQWSFVEILIESRNADLTWSSLWVPHNEHRLLVPRLVWLGLAWMSDWDIRWELVANSLLAGSLFAALARAVIGAKRSLVSSHVSLALIALLVFNLQQVENWTWGWQVSLLLAATCGATAITLAAENEGLLGTLGAAALATIAGFSYASGILVWPLGALAHMAKRPVRVGRIALWLSVSGACIASYAHRLVPLFALHLEGTHAQGLGPVALYVLAYLGSPLVGWAGQPSLAGTVGFVGLAVFCALLWTSTRTVGLARTLSAAWLLVGLFGIGNAILAAAARSPDGPMQALSSRYTTFGNLFWFAIVLGCLGLAAPGSVNRDTPPRAPAPGGYLVARGAWAIGAALMVVGLAGGMVRGLQLYTAQHAVRSAIRERLIAGDLDPGDFAFLYPEPFVLLRSARSLCEMKMGVFRDQQPPGCTICVRSRAEPVLVRTTIEPNATPATGWARLDTFENGSVAIFQGWAMEGEGLLPAQEVAVSGPAIDDLSIVRRRRPRVAEDRANRCATHGGFELRVAGSFTTEDLQEIRIFVKALSGDWRELPVDLDERESAN